MSRAGRAILALVVVGAAVARGWGLGRWSLDGDELYSFYDVQRLLQGGPWPEGPSSHPLGYLGMAAVVAVGGLDAGTLRLFPAACGWAAVVALACLRRDVLAAKPALAAATLAAVSPWLIYHAQTARFYAPLLLWATLVTLWVLPGPGRRPWLATIAFVLAMLTHPSAVLLAPFLAWGLWRGGPSASRRGLAAVAAAALAGALWLAVSPGVRDVLRDAFARNGLGAYGVRHFVMGLGYNLGPEVGLLGLAGLAVTWRRREPAACGLAGLAVLVVGLLMGAALAGISVHQRYAMVGLPALLLVAGRGWAALADRSLRLATLVAAIVLLATLPRLVDHYAEGNRSDWRAAAAWLAANAGPDDIIVSDEHATLDLYLARRPGFGSVTTVEAPPDERRMASLPGNRREVWAVVKANRLGAQYPRAFVDWLESLFVERAWIGHAPGPLVRHDNRLVILRRTARVSVPRDEAGAGR